ncbi:peptidoglycan editing factor PgeF [Roseburia hominis]
MNHRLQYKGETKVYQEVGFDSANDPVPFLKFPLLEKTGVVNHGISTRLGGVSTGYLSSMNLSYTRGDDPENVLENYRRMADAIGVKVEQMVATHQTHTTNVRLVTREDAGKGVIREKDYTDVDGLMTNVPGICLVTFYADCVPLFFVDPVRRVIASSHSGWRGTVGKMGRVTIEKMRETYGCCPEDIYAAIGPSICQDCYEVSEDVIDQFKQAFPKEVWSRLFYSKENGKYQLDLWKANEQVLLDAGILPTHLTVNNVCTCCNPDLLFSHRASQGKRGNLAAFLALKEENE